MSTQLDEALDEALDTLMGQDASKMTHFVHCPEDKDSAQAWVDEARADGLEVEALCGYVWIPESDPIRHPVCQTCIEIAQIRLA